MTSRDSDPVHLTRGELRRILEGADLADGAFAEAMDVNDQVKDLRRELEALRSRFEDVVDFMLDVYEAWQGTDEDAAAIRKAGRQATLERYARAFLDAREADGTVPTQEALADVLGVTDRRVRQVGWAAIQARAAELDRNS